MQEGLRSTGIEVIGDATWGTHFCQFYRSPQDLLDILVPYFKAGLENNEFCMWVTSEPLGASEAREALAKALPDLDRYLASGQLEILPHNRWYVQDGVFDSQRVLEGWLDKLERARARGFDGLRLTGNTFWLEKSDWEDFTQYEAEVDSVIGYHRIIAVCTYCIDRCSASEVIDVIKNHQFALIKREGRWETVQSAERQRAEEARAHLATIVQSSGDAIIGKSLDGTIASWNPGAEQLYGYEAQEMIGKPIALLFPPELIGERDSILERVKQGEVVRLHETVRVRKDGSRVDVSAGVFPIRDRQGRVTAAAAIARDITDRKRAEAERESLLADLGHRAAELNAANKELEAFSYSVSHDLRAPLRSIDGFSQALLEDYADSLDAQGMEYLRMVRSQSRRMAELIDTLLTLSRITRVELRREDVDLSTVARKIAGDLLAAEPRRSVEFAIAPGLVANGDPRLLQIALENLLGNAWKFTARHPRARIEFGAIRQEEEVAYFVRDDGAGFDMAYANKLFVAFQRLHGQEEFSGNGVGLATVQRVVRRHGGRIWAEGQVERGATFYFTL